MSYAMYLISTKFPEMYILFRSCSWINIPSLTKYHFLFESGESIVNDNTFIILNALNNHWVLLTNFNNEKNSWTLYDSLDQPRYLNL